MFFNCFSFTNLSSAFNFYLIPGKTSDILPYLDTLQFRNGPSFVYANQSFGWQQFCAFYTEPEDVSTIRYGWDTMNMKSYLFQNPGDPKNQQSPPMGMRSAVPLGGLGKEMAFIVQFRGQ